MNKRNRKQHSTSILKFFAKVRYFIFPVLSAICILTVYQSCKPEFPTWEANTVFPLFNSRMYISDFAGDTLLVQDEDSLLNLYYDYNLTDFDIDSLISGLDTVAAYTYTSPFSITLSPGSQIISKSEVGKLSLQDVYLKVMEMSQGKIMIKTANTYTQPIRIEYSLPDASINGIPFTVTREIPAAISPAKPYQYEEEITFTNLRWLFFSQGLANFNCFNSSFKVWISSNATENVLVNAGDPFTFFLGFKDLNISYARGYFGQHHYGFDEESDVDMFKKISVDQFNIDKVALTLEVTNNIGMDLRLRFRQLTGKNTMTGNSVNYEGPWLNTPIQIARATETSPEGGLAQPMSYSYDLSVNSNLKQFIENLPGRILTSLEFDLNPLGNVSGGNDFYYGKPLMANLVFKMPLNFSLQNLRITDTLTFSKDFLKSQIQSLTIKAIVQNCFPLEFNMSLGFLDSSNVLLSSHQFDMPVKASPVSSNGRTSGPEQSTVFLHISGAELNMIRNEAAYISISASVSSKPAGDLVKIYSDYFLDIRTFAMLNLLIHQAE
jgi:hypothetical protein